MNYELSYVSPRDPAWQRLLMRSIETLSGRQGLLPVYHRWRDEVAGKHPQMMQEAMRMANVGLDIDAAPNWNVVPADQPLVIVANHPFGIADGMGLLAIAEHIGRPYRVLINAEFMRVPEIRSIALPIDFSAGRQAQRVNLESRAKARALLKEGVTIAVFPAGGVATAERIGGMAEELPWKPFASSIVEHARASVLPVYFHGQNSRLFHLISRYSTALRVSLLVAEFRHALGSDVRASIGQLMPYEELATLGGRRAITEELYVRVHRLMPGAADLPRENLLPRPHHLRRKWPWEQASPLDRSRGSSLETITTH